MNIPCVLALLPLFIVLAHSFSWDIVVARDNQLEFFYNGKITFTKENPSYWDIYAVTYDPLHLRVLFVDHAYKRMTLSSYDLTTGNVKTFIRRQTKYVSYINLAYDPITQLVFWTEDREIYSFSLKPATSNKTVVANLLVTLEDYCWDIAVDSCRGFIYWTVNDKIERAAFDGSERELLIKDSDVLVLHSLAIDQQTKIMYWIEEATDNLHCIKSADLNGKNRRTVYYIGQEDIASALDISKDFIYWRSHNQRAILQLPKHQQHGVAPTVYSQSNNNDAWYQFTAANYTIEEQTLGNKSCEALKRLMLEMKERRALICHNYCFQGNCRVDAEEHPKCSCNRGYSGERCEVDACHKHCFNDGVCSVNEAEKPVCQCTADYQGERCDVSICKDFCLQGICSVSTEGQPTCRCFYGYSGVRCEVKACYMYCLNNGVCSMNEADKPVCQCTADYEGKRCDISICKDYCMQGKCTVSAEGQRTCSCNRGYSGERCDVSICKDYCLEGNCSISTEGQRTCRCNAGYSGERCEIYACHEYCLNNGVCSLNEEKEPVCQCTADYEGERCDVATTYTDACVCADKLTQQMLLDLRSEVKLVKEDLQCTLQLYTDKLDENAAKIQICEEATNDNQQNYHETMSKPQP